MKMMRNLAAVLALSLTAVLLTACGNNDSASKPQAAKPEAAPPPPPAMQKIVVGLDDNFPPMGFRDEQGNIVGFDIDFAREATRRMGAEVEFKAIDWNAKEAELNGKRVDMLWNGLTITEERKKNISFTTPYMENHQIVIVAAASPIAVKTDLKDKVIGVQDGSSAVDAIQKEPEIEKSFKDLKKYGDNVTALLDLNAGRIDALVLDEVVGRYYVAKKPGEYKVLDENFGAEEYGVGLRKEDTTLLENLQKAMDEMKQDGSAARIAEQWFGKNIIK